MSDDKDDIPRKILGDKTTEDKIIRFPSLADRDRIKREEKEKDKQAAKAFKKKSSEPFLNLSHIPPVTRILAAVCLGLFLVTELVLDYGMRLQIITYFGFTPGYYSGVLEWSMAGVLGPFTYAFLHGGWMHIGFNIVMLLALGMMFEKMLGSRGFLIFFFAASLGGALLTAILSPQSSAPVVGASGGLSGLFGAMIVVFYDMGQFGPIRKLKKLGVWGPVGLWAVIMLIMGLSFGGVAWQAHLGGYITGVLLIVAKKKGLIKL
jgi:membrane associated rhomboid family serine protease